MSDTLDISAPPASAGPGAAAGPEGTAYQVLARKYRPQNFNDLIGHEAMVKTLANAFATSRIAHAYILTGVRGVGKTTTARILARALNYVGPDGADNGPQIEMLEEGRHCAAIAASRHPDVMEMDAASRTGVGDIRELIEGVRYAPVEARYKVYIIDEVHMLSTAAFNALLKTLEEPPAHVKFIFATTEIRKLPVTVLSRCQRFDLRRIAPEVLCQHLGRIAQKEGAEIAPEALAMIARAAEGSVRDALSILDQAIVQHSASAGDNGPTLVSADSVRDMLGLVDRDNVWTLMDACFGGDAARALAQFRTQYDAGAEPAVVLRDMLDLAHLLTRTKAAGPDAAHHGPAGSAEAARAQEMADKLTMNALTRSWSLLMKGLGETQSAPDPAAAAEMALIRFCYASSLPTLDEALKELKKKPELARAQQAPQPNTAHRAAAPAGMPPPPPPHAEQMGDMSGADTAPPILNSFEDLIRLARAKRDAKLCTELESYVHLISFARGHIELRPHSNAPADLANRLTLRLKEWTKEQWIVSLDTERKGAQTVRDARIEQVMADPLVAAVLEVFPGAEISSIREPEILAPPPKEDEGDEQDGAPAAAQSKNS